MRTTQTTKIQTKSTTSFQYLITIKPLGFLYGSAGRFLSPENLVGRSGTSFPPNAATLSGVFAHHFNGDQNTLDNLQLAGPFWSFLEDVNNFFVPTPMNCLSGGKTLKDKINKLEYLKIKNLINLCKFCQNKWLNYEEMISKANNNNKLKICNLPPTGKFESKTWIAISDWEKLQKTNTNLSDISVYLDPWQFNPHLHPKLEDKERITQEGELFLENAVELNPNTCLVYLSNIELPSGWYRFGGEGHIVEIESTPIEETVEEKKTAKYWLNQPLKTAFALITPAIWGSNRFSFRAPKMNQETGQLYWGEKEVKALLTKHPITHRYRLGNRKNGHQKHQPKLLSRGRYAVPSGSVYVLDEPLNCTWQNLEDSWFPREGYYSMKRWGCGLALPLESAITF